MSGMKTSLNNTILYNQDDFERDMKALVQQLKDKEIDLIIGLNRGGCLPAVCLSHALKKPATMIDWSTRDGANITPKSIYSYIIDVSAKYKNILIVDDLIDSGKSMKDLLYIITMYCNTTVATLLHNTDVELGVPHYSGTKFSRKDEPRYFDFWWEIQFSI